MPFALLIVGVVLVVTALRGQTGTLFSLIKSDFTGSGNFLYWVVAILAIGSVGYVKKLQPISDAFLALVLIVLMLANKGFFSQFMQGLQSSGSCPQSSASPSGGGTIGGVAQATANALPNNAVFNSGDSLQTQLNNSYTNLSNALNMGANYMGY